MGGAEKTDNPPLSFWLARGNTGYVLGRGDQEIASGQDRASAHVLAKAPAMLETLRKIGQAESFGLTFEQVQAMAKGMVETVQALAFQQDSEHCDAISD
jgi:hypothetical protein